MGATWGRHDGHRWHWQLSCFRTGGCYEERSGFSGPGTAWMEGAGGSGWSEGECGGRSCGESGSGFCQSDLWTWFPDVMFLAKIFQSGITVASHVNPQDPPSINLGLLGWKLSLVWGGWAVPSWACDFLLICGLDWNKWILELWIQNSLI